MEIILEKDLEDRELTASGIADEEVYEMWKSRLDRLTISQYYPEKIAQEIKRELLSLFKNPEHINNTKVKFIVAKRFRQFTLKGLISVIVEISPFIILNRFAIIIFGYIYLLYKNNFFSVIYNLI